MDDDRLGYNDKLDATDQVDAEEMIASMIFDARDEDRQVCEGDCAQLGRDILLQVLATFRPDLVE